MRKIIFFIVCITITLLCTGFFLTYRNEQASKTVVAPVDKIADTPTPTPPEKSQLAIHIFNGNGKTQASKKVSDILEGLGYNVVQLSNAQRFDYETMEIRIKSDKMHYLEDLKKALSSQYEIGSISSELLQNGINRDDVQIIVGER